jgi:hypothetical protein
MAFGFYTDSNLVYPINGNIQVNAGSHDYQFYLGSPTSGTKLQDATSPGVSTMEITVEDSDPGNGAESSWIKLALTQGELAGAIAGDPLNIGTTVLGGTGSSLIFWVRVSNTLSGSSSSTDLSLKITNVKEFMI